MRRFVLIEMREHTGAQNLNKSIMDLLLVPHVNSATLLKVARGEALSKELSRVPFKRKGVK